MRVIDPLPVIHANERQEQITTIDWLRIKEPWLINYTIFIMNERKCSVHMGAIYNKMGRLEGASDLFIAWPTLKHFGLFIEMKTKSGRATKKQLEFIKRMNSIGYYACVCKGADDAISVITRYLKGDL
jgi:hypothetical protein